MGECSPSDVAKSYLLYRDINVWHGRQFSLGLNRLDVESPSARIRFAETIPGQSASRLE